MEAWESCGDFFWRLPLHNSQCAAHHFNNGLCTGLVQAPGLPLAEDKLPDFEDRAEMLGVEVDLSRAAAGKISVENKPQRKTELAEAISSIIKEGSVVPAKLPSILGCMQFADMQLSVRLGKLAMADVRDLGTEPKTFAKLTHEGKNALMVLRERMTSGRTKTLKVEQTRKLFALFTDGAFEQFRRQDSDSLGRATIRGALFCPDGKIHVFGCNVDAALLEEWLCESQHPIGLIELYAIVVAYGLWGHLFSQRRILLFGDSWAANDVFVKGTSSIKPWRRLLLELEKLDSECGALAWMAGVPSSSSIADPPSRGSIHELKHFSPKLEVNIRCPDTHNVLEVCPKG